MYLTASATPPGVFSLFSPTQPPTPTQSNRSISPTKHHRTVIQNIMAPKVQKWDDDVHRHILLALFETAQPAGVDWDSIMAKLSDRGYTFTQSALR